MISIRWHIIKLFRMQQKMTIYTCILSFEEEFENGESQIIEVRIEWTIMVVSKKVLIK